VLAAAASTWRDVRRPVRAIRPGIAGSQPFPGET
jgi:hypothetical protein